MLNRRSCGAKKGFVHDWELARKGCVVKVYLVTSYFRSNGCGADTGTLRLAVSYRANKGRHKLTRSFTGLLRYSLKKCNFICCDYVESQIKVAMLEVLR